MILNIVTTKILSSELIATEQLLSNKAHHYDNGKEKEKETYETAYMTLSFQCVSFRINYYNTKEHFYVIIDIHFYNKASALSITCM